MTSESEKLAPCPFCGRAPVVGNDDAGGWSVGCNNDSCGVAPAGSYFRKRTDAIAAWNRRSPEGYDVAPLEQQDRALKLLAAEDARQAKLHELLETIREQIRNGVAPQQRPEGLFENIQNAVYAMRGRTRLLDDAAIIAALRPRQGTQFILLPVPNGIGG